MKARSDILSSKKKKVFKKNRAALFQLPGWEKSAEKEETLQCSLLSVEHIGVQGRKQDVTIVGFSLSPFQVFEADEVQEVLQQAAVRASAESAAKKVFTVRATT